MVFGKLIRYGIPLGLVHCTIYQQNIWREYDDRLWEEQRQSWRKFFGLIDKACDFTSKTLHLTDGQKSEPTRYITSKIDNLDIKRCWNSKVTSFFSGLDILINKPSYAACLVYRKIQPQVTKPPHQTDTS